MNTRFTCIQDLLHHKSRPKEVLFVDDDEILGELIKTLSRKWNVHMTLARDGVEGLEMFKHRTFELVIIDLCMPKVNGTELFREIKRTKPAQAVCIFSGFLDTEKLIELKRIGFAIYAHKPDDYTPEFFSALFRALGFNALKSSGMEDASMEDIKKFQLRVEELGLMAGM